MNEPATGCYHIEKWGSFEKFQSQMHNDLPFYAMMATKMAWLLLFKDRLPTFTSTNLYIVVIEGIFGVMITVIGNGHNNPSSNLDEAVLQQAYI